MKVADIEEEKLAEQGDDMWEEKISKKAEKNSADKSQLTQHYLFVVVFQWQTHNVSLIYVILHLYFCLLHIKYNSLIKIWY